MKRIMLLCLIGLLITEIGFAQWQPIFNSMNGGSVRSIAKDPITNYIYAGTLGGGIFVSTDNGDSWTAKNNGLLNWIVECVLINNNIIWAGTAGGLFLSTDNGNSWTARNNGLLNHYVTSIAFSGNTIFAGTIGGIFRSIDNGSTWVSVATFYARAIVISGSKIFSVSHSGLYMSSDLGNTWSSLKSIANSGTIYSLAVSQNNIYVGAIFGIYLSTDDGDSWTTLYQGGGLPCRSILIKGTMIYAGGLDGLYSSTNSGNTWIKATLDKSIYQLFSIDDSILAATADGIFLSTDDGNNWTSKNSGLSMVNINSLSVDQENIYISASSNTSSKFYRSFDNGVSWWSPASDIENISSIAINDNGIFVGTPEGIYFSTDKGNSWTAKNNGLDNTSIRTITISDGNIFAGTGGGIFLSTDNGNSWNARNNGITHGGSQPLSVLAIAVIDNRIYASFSFGTYLSMDNGSTWTAINAGLLVQMVGTSYTFYYIPRSFIKNNGFVYGATAKGIYKFSESDMVWQPVISNLPESLTVSPFASYENNVFIGTSEGLFLSIDSCNSWTNVTDGYVYPLVSEIAFTDTEILIGTSGAGAWKRLISDLFYLNTTTNAITINEAANSAGTFNLTSLNTYWKISSSDSWLTVSTSSGTGNATITVTGQENTSTSPRTATITISGTSVETKTITVTQKGVALYLNTSVTSLPLGSAEGASGTFDITSNTSWTASSSDTWLTITNASGSTNGTVTVTAQKNPTINTRNATITVKATGLPDKTVTVTQVGAPTGIADSEGDQIKIYPNPANTILVIEGLSQEVQVSIYDIQGRLVLKKELRGNVLDVSSLSSGIYSVVLENNKETIQRKFVKE